jgi:hypothetical protein
MFWTICPSAVAGLVALELCGVMVILGWLQKTCSAGNGSVLNTSKTAWRKRPASMRGDQGIFHDQRTASNIDQWPETVNLLSALWRS